MAYPYHGIAVPTRRSAAVLLLALGLLVGELVFFAVVAREIGNMETRQTAEGRALFFIREVVMDVQDAETGQRGYLLTGDTGYLEPFLLAKTKLTADLRAAHAATWALEDRGDAAHMAAAERAIDAKMAELNHTVDLREGGDMDGALQVVRSGAGRRLMQDIRSELTILMNHVRGHRDRLSGDVGRKASEAALAFGSIALTVVLLVAYAWSTIVRVGRKNALLTQQLAIEASRDTLTGLANRRLFERWLAAACAGAQRTGSTVCLLYIDLDGFKAVNDEHGHAVGDQVLAGVASRLRAITREADLLARLGGDEFALVLAPEQDAATTGQLAERVLRAARQPLNLGGLTIAVGASVGLARLPGDAATPDDLCRAADRAMYRAKARGRNCVAIAGEPDPAPAA